VEDLTGKQFGHYQVVAPLGEGGMAAVYKAFQPAMERYVAIKVLPRNMSSSDEFVERFRREARMLARLQHPNILSVFDYGEQDGYPYIVMPFVKSGTLSEALRDHPLTFAEINAIISQIGAALAYAHSHGMIHRDVKPSNVLIDDTGNCLLTDFGLARMTEASIKITSSGAVMGTPAYMAPEQGTGAKIDHRSDIYSLGVILYEMLTGRVPYTAETPIAVVVKHIQDPLPSARKINPKLPESIELILMKALAKNPDDRYQNAEDLVHALQAAISTMELEANVISRAPIVTAKPTMPKTFAKTRLAKKEAEVPGAPTTGMLKIFLGAGVLLFLVGGGIVFSLLLNQKSPNRDAAMTSAAASPITNPPMDATLTLPPEASPTVPTSSPAPSPSPEGPEPVITDDKGVTMVLIPAGDFSMGNSMEQSLTECIRLFPKDATNNCKEEYFADETPSHKVFLDSFYFDQYEVTNLLYKACVNAGACQPPSQTGSETHEAYYGETEFNDYPVIWVNWNMAKTYCEWRGARLPTEAEWEKAARGNSTQNYPWGATYEGLKANSCDINCPRQFANKSFADGFDELAPVTAFPDGVSSYGIFNLSGNVSEWVSDWYSSGYYTLTNQNGKNPPGPEIGEERVFRGGSWSRFPINLRLVTRSKKAPDFIANDLGFRCASPVP